MAKIIDISRTKSFGIPRHDSMSRKPEAIQSRDRHKLPLATLTRPLTLAIARICGNVMW